jgi:hypothetical protein
MNLHNIVSGAIGSVNPFIPVVIKHSTGYTTSADGPQIPSYTVINTQAQIQALSGSDIMRLNNLNVQGVTCKAYLNGNTEGLFRVLGKGGDLISFGGQTYLVTQVMERWPDWCSLALTMQVTP